MSSAAAPARVRRLLAARANLSKNSSKIRTPRSMEMVPSPPQAWRASWTNQNDGSRALTTPPRRAVCIVQQVS
eukprot:3837643-Pleurochrysis_carterae.AAC.1